jgi:DNA-binding CsgD family transcriptional regulator
LAADRGRPAEALNLLHRFLRQVPNENRTDRAAAFGLIVRVHADLGQADEAESMLSELEALAACVPTAPMRASAALARGVVAAAVGDHATARRHFEDAVDLFQATGAPFETAAARLELARQLAELGFEELATREARAAYDACSAIGATLLARRATALLRGRRVTGIGDRRREPVFGLTARELEILRLVAQGLSNPQIADALARSEHTVRRHLANILRKLDVPSRAAAAAVAARNELI